MASSHDRDGIKVYSESKNCGHNNTNGKPMLFMVITIISIIMIMIITKMIRLPPLPLDKTGEGKPGETLLVSVGFLTFFNFSWFPGRKFLTIFKFSQKVSVTGFFDALPNKLTIVDDEAGTSDIEGGDHVTGHGLQ